MHVGYARYGHDGKRERVQRVPFFSYFCCQVDCPERWFAYPGNLRHV
jgi:hypothetical protein